MLLINDFECCTQCPGSEAASNSQLCNEKEAHGPCSTKPQGLKPIVCHEPVKALRPRGALAFLPTVSVLHNVCEHER